MGTFSDLAQRIDATALSWMHGIMYVGIMLGMVLVITGINRLAMQRNSGIIADGFSGASLIFCGILLVSLTAYLGTGSATLFGSDQTASQLQILTH